MPNVCAFVSVSADWWRRWWCWWKWEGNHVILNVWRQKQLVVIVTQIHAHSRTHSLKFYALIIVNVLKLERTFEFCWIIITFHSFFIINFERMFNIIDFMPVGMVCFWVFMLCACCSVPRPFARPRTSSPSAANKMLWIIKFIKVHILCLTCI